jgi:DNA-directed RNA polymerase specialized sigma24 family protein
VKTTPISVRLVNVTSIGGQIRELTAQLRDLRRREAARLHREGKSLREIAAELDVSPPTVLADLRAAGVAAAHDNDPEPINEPTDTGQADEFDPEAFLSSVSRTGGTQATMHDLIKGIPR